MITGGSLAGSMNWDPLCGCSSDKGPTILGFHLGAPAFCKLPFMPWEFCVCQCPRLGCSEFSGRGFLQSPSPLHSTWTSRANIIIFIPNKRYMSQNIGPLCRKQGYLGHYVGYFGVRGKRQPGFKSLVWVWLPLLKRNVIIRILRSGSKAHETGIPDMM